MVCHFLNPLGSSLSSARFLRLLLWPPDSTSETLPPPTPPVSAAGSRQVAALDCEDYMYHNVKLKH